MEKAQIQQSFYKLNAELRITHNGWRSLNLAFRFPHCYYFCYYFVLTTDLTRDLFTSNCLFAVGKRRSYTGQIHSFQYSSEVVHIFVRSKGTGIREYYENSGRSKINIRLA